MLRTVLGWALFIAVCCALAGGITVNGQHHGASCDCEKGVVVQ